MRCRRLTVKLVSREGEDDPYEERDNTGVEEVGAGLDRAEAIMHWDPSSRGQRPEVGTNHIGVMSRGNREITFGEPPRAKTYRPEGWRSLNCRPWGGDP